jgi:N-methylhydantoinase B
LKIDPITFEVLKNEIISIIEEMGALLKRSSFSPNVRERDDSSCSIFDSKGESIVEAKQVPLQIGILPLSMAEALKKFGNDLREGDMVIMNDPYLGGSHLPDIIIIAPIFYRKKCIGFVGNLAHHNDLGGMSPRSICGDATELVQEGLRFPCVKLCEKGNMKREIIELLMANTRTPRIEQGDVYAQINANLLGIRRMQEVCDKHR